MINDASQGDRDAIGVLYRNHVGMVWGYLRACGAADAEDLTSEVFVGMLRGLTSFEGGPSEFRAWLMTIAYRRMVDARRRQGLRDIDLREPSTFDLLVSARPSDLTSCDVDPRLIEAFASLTESQREVLALRFVADLGLERVATITGRPVGAVKSLQHRGLATLRTVLSEAAESDEEAVTR